LRDASGAMKRVRLDNVVNATPDEVRDRFRNAVTEAAGEARTLKIEQAIENLDSSDNAGRLALLLRVP
jgi:hypothetical protein